MLRWPIITALTWLLLMHYMRLVSYARSPEVSGPARTRIAVAVATLCSMVPLGTLLAFAWVFLQGGSFSAQYPGGHDLWSV